MRFYLSIVAVFISFSVWAQDKQKSVQKTDSLSKIAEKKITNKTDSSFNKVDSAAKSIAKFKIPGQSNLNKLDSLNPSNKITGKSNELNQKMRSMTRVDSLFLFDKDMKKVDSLKLVFQNKSNEIKKKVNRKQKKIKHSLDSLESSYQKQANAITSKFMAKNKDLMAGHEKEIASKMNLNAPAVSREFPNLNPNTSLPGSSTNLPTNIQSLPTLNGNTTNTPSLPNTSLPNTSLNVPALNNPLTPLQKELQNESGELKKLEQEGGAYEKQLKQLKKDSLANGKQIEKWTEDQIQGRKEIKALRDQELEKKKLENLQQQYLDKVAKYKSPEKIEAEIKQNMTKVANSDLLKHDKVFQSAQGDMAKAKKKYGEFQSIKNLPKRPLNPMSQLPFRERIYPGIFFQTSNGKFFSLDIAPQAYYKITTRFDVGLGAVYRINYDFKKSTLVQNNDLYGFKVFSNFKIYKTFYFRLEGERIHKQQPIIAGSDLTYSRWTNTLLGGIGKEFLISKKIQANSLVLYNALDKYDNPYASKVLFRIGFSLSLKKDQRKQFIKSLNN